MYFRIVVYKYELTYILKKTTIYILCLYTTFANDNIKKY